MASNLMTVVAVIAKLAIGVIIALVTVLDVGPLWSS